MHVRLCVVADKWLFIVFRSVKKEEAPTDEETAHWEGGRSGWLSDTLIIIVLTYFGSKCDWCKHCHQKTSVKRATPFLLGVWQCIKKG